MSRTFKCFLVQILYRNAPVDFPKPQPAEHTSVRTVGLKNYGKQSGNTSMSRWTAWRKIADRHEWFGDELDWDGPACYELAIAGPRGGGLNIVYIGETINERRRVIAYASHGSHLAKIIAAHLKDGWILHYRAQAKDSKEEVVRMQNRLLSQYDYDWNIQLNSK